MNRFRNNVPPWFLVPVVLFGAAFVCKGFWELAVGYSSKQWPGTNGVITSASIQRQHGLHHGNVYSPNISYDYQVAGVAYAGTRIRFGMTLSAEREAQAAVNRYPPRQQVRVFYSPADPAKSVLETGISIGVWLELGLGGVFFATGVAGLLFRRRQPGTVGSISSSPNLRADPAPGFLRSPIVALGSILFLLMVAAMSLPVLYSTWRTSPRRSDNSVLTNRNIDSPQAAAMADTRDFSVSGSGFTVEPLSNGQIAFSNRGYTWQGVPEKYAGWRYTKTAGGSHPEIVVHIKNDSVLQMVTATDQPGTKLAGWERTGIEFHYTDDRHTRMTLCTRKVKAGEEIRLPEDNWTGGLLLWSD